LDFSSWTIKPWFHTEGKLATVLITPSLGVSNWMVIYIINTVPPAMRSIDQGTDHCAASSTAQHRPPVASTTSSIDDGERSAWHYLR
jgi:hypothetical protein